LLSITERGLDVLRKKPKKIDNNLLRQFPEFLEFQNIKKDSSDVLGPVDISQNEQQTPEETIDLAYQNIRQPLAQELIDTVRRLSPAFFERLVVELVVKMGYGGSIKDAGKAIGKSGDEGIDGTIKEHKRRTQLCS
jgi:restriction system protein